MRTQQAPIGSGFGAATTANEVIQGCDLTGKVAIVTGGYAGIGLVTTRTLLAAGAKVVVPARDQAKAMQALGSLPIGPAASAASTGLDPSTTPRLIVESLDLMDPSSIDAFAERFLAGGEPLHILVNNAGTMANPLTRDARGYESQFSTNHLGHFQLTLRLWPALRQASGARVVSVSSRGHAGAAFDFDDPNFERRQYDRWTAYRQSKTANVLFAVALDAKAQAHGVRAFSLHPGGIITDLVRHMSDEDLRPFGVLDESGQPIIDPAADKKTPEQGAATSLWCATSRQLEGLGGVYCENCDIASPQPADSTALLGVRPFATDPELAERLWHLSEQLTGVTDPL